MSMKFRALWVAGVLLAMMWTVGCGHYNCHATFGNSSCNATGSGLNQGGTGIGVTAFVYFMDDGHQQIAAEGLNVNNSGTFAPISGFATPTFSNALKTPDGGLVVVNKKFLYIPFQPLGAVAGPVYAFSINGSSGALTAISGTGGTSPFNSDAGGTVVAADPAGKFLFVGGPGGISAYTINADGSLTVVAGSPFATGLSVPQQMTTDGAGKFLYVMDGTTIVEFSYNGTTGVLTSLGSLASPMLMLASEPSGKYMIGVTEQTGGGGGTLDDHVYVFAIAPSTATTPGLLGQPTPFSTTTSPSYVVVSPNGAFVYTFNEDQQTSGLVTPLQPIQFFPFNSSTGGLGAGTVFPDVLSSIGKFDQSGEFLFAVGQSANVNAAGSIPIAANPSTGALSSSLAHAGAASFSFAVTDAP
jgi:6-phosphogluconolactonase (cycloisomerase 2 family)